MPTPAKDCRRITTKQNNEEEFTSFSLSIYAIIVHRPYSISIRVRCRNKSGMTLKTNTS